MGKLSKLSNIGKVVEAQLNQIGIITEDDLKSVGARQAWLKIQEIDESACINRLLALEGAIQGVKKTELSDDVGEHDLLHPCCRPEMYDFFYNNGNGHSNCLENINKSLNSSRPIIHPVNFFMYTKINADGSISVEKPISKAGDKVVLRALMDVRIGATACSVSESNCNGGKCSPIKIIVSE